MAGEPLEGVVRYQLGQGFEKRPLPLGVEGLIAGLNYWRNVLWANGLIGVGNDGVGYGNISCRTVNNSDGIFVITSTQTGRKKLLSPEDYAAVTDYHLGANRLEAYGPLLGPSSEAMTHGALYEEPTINAVCHGHSSLIWCQAEALGITPTRADIEYGTPEMAQEMLRLLHEPDVIASGILVMGGHIDGIITFGPSLDDAGMRMLNAYTAAQELEV